MKRILRFFSSLFTPSNPTNDFAIVNNYIKKYSTARERRIIKTKFDGVLKYWSQNATSMLIYQKYKYEISDIVIFNKRKNKVLLLTVFISDGGYGHVDLHAGALKKDGLWYFHHSGLPGFTYGKPSDQTTTYTNDFLLKRSLGKLIDDGLIKRGSVNQDYINTKWF